MQLTDKNAQFWWRPDLTDGKQVASSVFMYVKWLEEQQSYRSDDNYRNMRLYGNLEAYALRGYNAQRAEPSSAVLNRVTLNIVQSMVDTVVSKLSKNKPKPTFLTEGGNWEMQRRAMKLTQFVEGQFQATKFYAARTMAQQDSCIFGTGPIKIFREGKEIKLERTFVDEIIVDDSEAIYGQPRQMHQKKRIHREVLKGMFPDYAADIDAAGSQELSQHYSNTSDASQTNMLEVIESWHLPSSKDAEDGRHTICIAQCTMLDESWKRSYFPFVFWRWSLRPLGFWGQGLSEQLSGLQLEINKILRTIQISMHLVSVPKLLIEASSKVVSAHLNNKIGGIIKYAGTAPSYASLGNIPPELFAHLDRLYNRAYEIAGISQLSAQSQKPAGLDSGKALREFNDIESERFMSVGQRDEECVMEASTMFIDAAKEIAEEFGDYEVKVSSGTGIKRLKWDEVNMTEDMYVMRVFPTSALSSTPSGKLQDVQELLQAGFINKEDGMKLLDFPDLRQFYNFNNAGVENIERTIELIIEDGTYTTPEPYQNLQYGIVKMQQAYLMYSTQGAPESRTELFRRWIEDANALLTKAAQPPAPPPDASMPQDPNAPQSPPVPMDAQLPGQATAVPAAPQVSDIMPVVPQG